MLKSILVAVPFVTNDHITVGAVITNRYVAASAVIPVTFMAMAPVAIRIDAGRPDAGMSTS